LIADFPASTIDVESYVNFFDIGLYDTTALTTRWWSTEPGIGEPLAAFKPWFETEKTERLWIGFNSCAYDNHLIRAVLNGQYDPGALHVISQTTINNGKDHRSRLEEAGGEMCVDLYAIFGGRVGSLKELACKIGFDTIQELPYHWDAVLTHDQMVEVASYNGKDLRITAQVAKIIEGQIAARIALSVEYGVRLLNKHDAGVAETLLAHRLFGGGKRMYPDQTVWHLAGSEVTAGFSFNHPNCKHCWKESTNGNAF